MTDTSDDFDKLCPLDGKWKGPGPYDVETCYEANCPYLHFYQHGTPRYEDYMKRKQERIDAYVDKHKSVRYLITFTRNTNIPKIDWFKSLCIALRSKQIVKLKALTIEHIDTNIHCHAYVKTKYANMSPSKFKAFSLKHRIDFKKVVSDNGVETYFQKENRVFKDIKEFKEYFEKLIS